MKERILIESFSKRQAKMKKELVWSVLKKIRVLEQVRSDDSCRKFENLKKEKLKKIGFFSWKNMVFELKKENYFERKHNK